MEDSFLNHMDRPTGIDRLPDDWPVSLLSGAKPLYQPRTKIDEHRKKKQR
jgi:hypothetical protein